MGRAVEIGMNAQPESTNCPGDWTSNNDCCGICSVHRNDHHGCVKTIRIAGREYKVTTRTLSTGELQYLLEGKRGAHYATMRNVNRPEMMFLIGAGAHLGGPEGKRTTWLTDKSGSLEVV